MLVWIDYALRLDALTLLTVEETDSSQQSTYRQRQQREIRRIRSNHRLDQVWHSRLSDLPGAQNYLRSNRLARLPLFNRPLCPASLRLYIKQITPSTNLTSTPLHIPIIPPTLQEPIPIPITRNNFCKYFLDLTYKHPN